MTMSLSTSTKRVSNCDIARSLPCFHHKGQREDASPPSIMVNRVKRVQYVQGLIIHSRRDRRTCSRVGT